MASIETERGFKPLPQLEESDYPENARRLLRVGIELFAEKGYSGTSVREIVQEAEVTNPMLYYYFDSKEGLYRQLVSLLFDLITEEIQEIADPESSLDDIVRGVITAHFREARRTPIGLKFIYAIIYGPSETAPSFDVFQARDALAETITMAFEQAIDQGDFEPHPGFEDPAFLTEQLLGLVNNHLQLALKRAEGRSDFKEHLEETLTDEMAERLQTFFFRGAGTRPG